MILGIDITEGDLGLDRNLALLLPKRERGVPEVEIETVIREDIEIEKVVLENVKETEVKEETVMKERENGKY